MKKIALITLLLILTASCAAPTSMATASPTFEITPTIASTETPTLTPTEQPIRAPCDQVSISSPEAPVSEDIFAANQRLGRTINLGEALEFPNTGNSYLIDKEEVFYMVANAGFTAVRVPINFAAHAESSPPYSIQDIFWKRVDSVVNKALKCGLVVIINMHNFGYEESEITYAKHNYFLALWDQIAQHYKDYPETSLYFELYNEPGDPYSWNSLVSKSIPVVRKSNPTRPIIIGVAEWGQMSGLFSLKLPDDQNLIASFHYYDPPKFTHQGAGFIENANQWLGTSWDGTPEEVAAIEQGFERAAKWAQNRRHPIPIFLGEFGSLSTADQASRVRWTTAVRQTAEAHGFSWGYWDLCKLEEPTFGILNCNIYVYKIDPGNIEILRALIPMQ